MRKKLFYVIVLMAFLESVVKAQPSEVKETEYRIHAIFIYNFIKYIQWPADFSTSNFTIGVIGESGITDELKKMAQSTSGGAQKITIKKYKSAGDVDKCHILYICGSNSSLLADVVHKVGSAPVLIVTQKKGLIKQGSSINFTAVDGKIRFEMNVDQIEKARMKVSTQLTNFAVPYQ